MFKFISHLHLTEARNINYTNDDFPHPTQADVDTVMLFVQKMVKNGTNINVPITVPPPLRLPVKQSGNLRRVWDDRIPEHDKSIPYTCSLFRLRSHTPYMRELHQAF